MTEWEQEYNKALKDLGVMAQPKPKPKIYWSQGLWSLGFVVFCLWPFVWLALELPAIDNKVVQLTDIPIIAMTLWMLSILGVMFYATVIDYFIHDHSGEY